MDGFGVPHPDNRDLAWVNTTLDDMSRRLYGVYGDVQTTLRDQIDGLATRLGRVDHRIRASLAGRLREMATRLSGPLTAIRQDVNGALDDMRGTLNLAAVHLSPVSSTALPGPMAPGAMASRVQVYSVLANPDCSEYRAVPGDLGDWYSMGWQPPHGWTVQGQITALPEEVPGILARWSLPCKTSPTPLVAKSP